MSCESSKPQTTPSILRAEQAHRILRWSRLCLATIPLAGATSCAASAPTPASTLPVTSVTPYAAVKRPMWKIAPRGEGKWNLPIPMPREGVLYAMGSFISPSAGYTLVDFEARTITRFGTILDTLPDGQIETPLTSRISRALSTEEMNQLVAAANKIWNPLPGTKRGSPMAMDATCNITLFDKVDVLNEFGMACPYDSEQLVTTLGAIKTDSR